MDPTLKKFMTALQRCKLTENDSVNFMEWHQKVMTAYPWGLDSGVNMAIAHLLFNHNIESSTQHALLSANESRAFFEMATKAHAAISAKMTACRANPHSPANRLLGAFLNAPYSTTGSPVPSFEQMLGLVPIVPFDPDPNEEGEEDNE